MTESEKNPKQRLLEAAIEVFADNGYDHATVREICGRAGTNVNAVKYYFEDKRGLYLAALRHSHQGVHQEMMAAPPVDGPPEQRLRWFVSGMIRTMLARTGRDTHQLLIVRELTAPTEGMEDIVEMFIRPRFQLLLDTLGELAPEVPSERIRLLGFSVIGQCMHYKMAMPVVRMLTPERELEGYTAEHLADHICRVTLAAIEQWSGAVS